MSACFDRFMTINNTLVLVYKHPNQLLLHFKFCLSLKISGAFCISETWTAPNQVLEEETNQLGGCGEKHHMWWALRDLSFWNKLMRSIGWLWWTASHVVSTERLEFLSGQWYHCVELHWNSFFYPFWNPSQNPFPHPHYGAWTSFLVFHL